MRFLHTGDWHLGRQIRGVSRQDEFEAVLGEVREIASAEKVDAVIVAGDIFDNSAPPTEAEELLYSTLAWLHSEGIRSVLIAGNHDHAQHLDALTHVLRLAGILAVGLPRIERERATLTVPSRDGSETATIMALPWVPERMALSFEGLFGKPETPISEYAANLERVIADYTQAFNPAAVNILAAHLLVDGAEVGEGGGERKIHIGQNFAVKAEALPADAGYIALGHVHRQQRIAHAAPAYYAGSLLQLDFGEGGQQKSVMVVDAKRGRPVDARAIPLSSGRHLRTVVTTLGELATIAERHGEDYLRVIVELEQNVPSLYERVRDVLPRAVEVTAQLTGETVALPQTPATRELAPDELFARFYRERRGGDVPEDLMNAFREIYSQELSYAAH